MTDFPKSYVKGERTRVAHNVRDEVKLQFEGYRLATMPTVAETPAQKSPEAPVLTELEMAKLPEAKDAEVVDLTGDTQKPTNPRSQR